MTMDRKCGSIRQIGPHFLDRWDLGTTLDHPSFMRAVPADDLLKLIKQTEVER